MFWSGRCARIGRPRASAAHVGLCGATLAGRWRRACGVRTDGSPLQPDSVSATVSALFKRLKIPKPKGSALHTLRHTHTSVLLAEGVPLPAVSARLGHSSVRTTQEIYAHMITGQDEEAARKWEEYQKRNRTASQPAKAVQ